MLIICFIWMLFIYSYLLLLFIIYLFIYSLLSLFQLLVSFLLTRVLTVVMEHFPADSSIMTLQPEIVYHLLFLAVEEMLTDTTVCMGAESSVQSAPLLTVLKCSYQCHHVPRTWLWLQKAVIPAGACVGII